MKNTKIRLAAKVSKQSTYLHYFLYDFNLNLRRCAHSCVRVGPLRKTLAIHEYCNANNKDKQILPVNFELFLFYSLSLSLYHPCSVCFRCAYELCEFVRETEHFLEQHLKGGGKTLLSSYLNVYDERPPFSNVAPDFLLKSQLKSSHMHG